MLIPTGAILRADATIPSHAHVRSAVRQWPGNVADLDFACVIREAPVFLLVAMHLPEVEALSQEDAMKKLVPASAKKKCAFYRVWVRRDASNPSPLACTLPRGLTCVLSCHTPCSALSSSAQRSRGTSPW